MSQEIEFTVTMALFIFSLDFLDFFLHVFYVNRIRDEKPIIGGLFAFILCILYYVPIYFIGRNIFYICPASLGAFVGHMLAMNYEKQAKKKRKRKKKTKQKKKEIEKRQNRRKMKKEKQDKMQKKLKKNKGEY